jgi:hypothetical protein
MFGVTLFRRTMFWFGTVAAVRLAFADRDTRSLFFGRLINTDRLGL